MATNIHRAFALRRLKEDCLTLTAVLEWRGKVWMNTARIQTNPDHLFAWVQPTSRIAKGWRNRDTYSTNSAYMSWKLSLGSNFKFRFGLEHSIMRGQSKLSQALFPRSDPNHRHIRRNYELWYGTGLYLHFHHFILPENIGRMVHSASFSFNIH